MKERWLSFLSPENSIIRYVVGTAALTVVIQVIYDLLKDSWDLLGTLILSVLLVIIVLIVVWYDSRQKGKHFDLDAEIQPIQPRKGVIILISPGNEDVPTRILEHHQSKMTHVWLISTPASLATADKLVQTIHQRWPKITVHPTHETVVDAENIENTWNIVRQIYTEWIPRNNLIAEDVVADITGGTKLMTAGMAIACLAPERDMEYVYTLRRREDGALEEGAPRMPIQISTRFVSDSSFRDGD